MQEALALRPAQSDQRIEVALVLCVSRDDATGVRTCLQSVREIIRTAAGGVQGLAAPLEDKDTLQFGGDLMSLLPAVRPRRAERRRASQAFYRSAVGSRRKPSFDC